MDEALVKNALSGDRTTFNCLIEKYQSRVYGLAYHITGNFADAEDLTQEAFIRAYLDLHQLREPQKFANWLYQVTRNICRMWLRKQMSNARALEFLQDAVARQSVSSPAEQVEKAELQDSVRNVIAALPENEQLTVTLYYMDGLTYREIADFMGVSQSTVKRRLRASRKKLKEELIIMVQDSFQEHKLVPEFTEEVSKKIDITDVLLVKSFAFRSPFQLSPDGEYLAYAVQDPKRRERSIRGVEAGPFDQFLPTGAPWSLAGSEIWVVHLTTGESHRLTPEERMDWCPRWSPDGQLLAFYSDRNGIAQLWVWNRETNQQRLVSKLAIRSHGGWEVPQWTPDGAFILAKLQPESPSNPGDKVSESQSEPDTAIDEATVTVWESEPTESTQDGKPREPSAPNWPLSSNNLRGELALFDVATGEVRRLTDVLHTYSWALSPDGSAVALLRFAGPASATVHQLLWDLLLVPLDGGEARPLTERVPQSSGVNFSWAPDGKHLAYTTSGSLSSHDVFIISTIGDEPKNLTATHKEKFVPFLHYEDRPLWSADSRYLFCVGAGHLWQLSVDGNGIRKLTSDLGRDVVGAVAASDAHVIWSPDDGRTVCVQTHDPATKQEGFYRVDVTNGNAQRLFEMPVRLGRPARFTLDVLVDGKRVFYIAEDATHPQDIWEADATFANRRQVTKLNPQLEKFAFGQTRIVEWKATDGRILRGALMLPAGYEPGKRYPLIMWIYAGESYSNYIFRFGLSNASQENFQLLASRGYAVLAVDTPLQTNEPLKELPGLVLPALDKMIELGIADSERFGIMGHSHGGYSVNALITQTTRFKAAISSAGPSDLVSLYGRLEKDGSSTSVGWAESGQGRMGGSLWEQRQRYIDNSPVFYLDKVETPLLLLHGEQDETLPLAQSAEMFVGLRRLGKVATLVSYRGEGHHPAMDWRHANVIDRWQRILNWFDKYLMAPRSF
ncbi:sigma-70 family RNA polymerase sigma factor, partial [Candidatus Poribacteria bacterium]|nr:sigma-70 family RNA polymerase sigma factor [Candidatus Poribacteria bacterium]